MKERSARIGIRAAREGRQKGGSEEERKKSILEKVSLEFELYGKSYAFETGELAKQATGAVLVRQGETTVLVTSVISKEEKDYDFFPLTVDFMEKMYAVGRIPGGYLKREGRASDKGTLTARMVDRPIRPGFAEGFKQEVHVVATTFAIDGENAPDCMCVGGASAALLIASAPFDGPVACVVSGGNNDVSRYADIVERSSVYEGLRHYFLVTFPQEPGALRHFLDGVLTDGEDIVLFEYTKKNNRETGPALVGIEIQDRARIGDLLTRMEASPLHIEKLEPDSPVFSFLL